MINRSDFDLKWNFTESWIRGYKSCDWGSKISNSNLGKRARRLVKSNHTLSSVVGKGLGVMSVLHPNPPDGSDLAFELIEDFRAYSWATHAATLVVSGKSMAHILPPRPPLKLASNTNNGSYSFNSATNSASNYTNRFHMSSISGSKKHTFVEGPMSPHPPKGFKRTVRRKKENPKEGTVAAYLKRGGVIFRDLKSEIHHIATNKTKTYRTLFEKIFEKAFITLESDYNKMRIIGHKGAHGVGYHEIILDRLGRAVHGKVPYTSEYFYALTNELNKIKKTLADHQSVIGRIVRNNR